MRIKANTTSILMLSIALFLHFEITLAQELYNATLNDIITQHPWKQYNLPCKECISVNLVFCGDYPSPWRDSWCNKHIDIKFCNKPIAKVSTQCDECKYNPTI